MKATRNSSDFVPVYSDILLLPAFFGANYLRPASVQRSFEWDEEEALTLLRDLDSCFADQDDDPEINGESEPLDEEDDSLGVQDVPEPYDGEDPPIITEGADSSSPVRDLFIGTMVLEKCENGALNIYDGLQRSTTLTILLSVLRDLAEPGEHKERLNRLVWNSDNEPRLNLRGQDKTLKRDVQETNGTRRVRRVTAKREVGKRIQRVKEAYLIELENWSPERRQRFGEFLLSNVYIGAIIPNDPRLARQIFVSTNLYGKRLDPLDVLKGQIAELASDDQEANEIVAIWTEIHENTGNQFENILRAVDVIERNEVQNNQWATELGDYLLQRLQPGQAVRWMKRLRGYANTWSDIKRVQRHGGETPLEQNLWRMRFFSWPEWHPLVLYYWNEIYWLKRTDRFKGRTAQFYQTFFNILHRRCMGLVLSGASPGKRKTIFAKAVKQAQNRQPPWQWSRRSGESNGALVLYARERHRINRTLRSQIKDYEIWSPLARWLEARVWRDELPRLMWNVTAEHILSRQPSTEAKTNPEEYDRSCFSLGNLAILPEQINKDLSNQEYEQKRPVLQDLSSKYVLLQSVVDHDSWGWPEISARASMLDDIVWDELKFKRPTSR